MTKVVDELLESAGRGASAYDTRAMAALAEPDVTTDVIATYGNKKLGDYGGGRYRRVGANPAHGASFQTADGAWWELMEDQVVTPQQFGADVDVEGRLWATATAYVVGDIRRQANNIGYICSVAHTSGASTEPGVGASWATVWTLMDQTGAINDAINWLYRADQRISRGGYLYLKGAMWVNPTSGVQLSDTTILLGAGSYSACELLANSSSNGALIKRPWTATTGGGYGRIRYARVEDVRVVLNTSATAQVGIDVQHISRPVVKGCVVGIQSRISEWNNLPTTIVSGSRGIRVGVAESEAAGYVGGEGAILEGNQVMYCGYLIEANGPVHGTKIVGNDLMECTNAIVVNHANSSNGEIHDNLIQFGRNAAANLVDINGHGWNVDHNYFERGDALRDLLFRSGSTDCTAEKNKGFIGYTFVSQDDGTGNTIA